MKEKPRTRSTGGGRPVIIANGFFPVPLPLGHIAAVYQAHGFAARIIPFALRNKIDVRTYAQTIGQVAREAHDETGLQVDIIGLSMGGIAALYAIKFLAAAPHIRTLIAIGSPFHGSPIAAMSTVSPWFSRTARQLAPDSELLKELRAAPRPPEVRFISLGGIFDTVSPLPTTRLDEAENYFWFFGHHDLMFLGWLHWEVVKLLL